MTAPQGVRYSSKPVFAPHSTMHSDESGSGRTAPVVTAATVAAAHAAGRFVHVWTVNDASDMVRLLDLGVDGIVSDRADVLRDVLLSRGQWFGT